MASKEPDHGGEKPKSRGKLFIIIGVVLVILLGAAGGAFFLLKSSDDGGDEEATTQEKPKKKKSEKEAHPTYVSLERFTVNLIPESGDQYLQVELSVELEDITDEEKMKMHMPKLRNAIMLLLSSKKASELNNKEGKETLAAEMREQMNNVLNPDTKGKGKGSEGPVKEVLFTSFIIQ